MLILPTFIDLPWTRPRVVVLEITGAIGVQVRAPEMLRTIKALREDKNVHAVVIDIESGGGSAPVSDAIYRSVKRLSAKKPTIAYVGSGALSGGYLIACAAREIRALPTALVGSIGVIFTRPVVQELMEKVGVKVVTYHAGKMKGMLQPWHEPTLEEAEKVQGLTSEYYEWFVDTVAKARNLPAEKVREYATGEPFTGVQAKEIGLVDHLGDFEETIDYAKSLVKAPEEPKLQYVRARRPLLDRLMARSAMSMADAVAARLEERFSPRIDLR